MKLERLILHGCLVLCVAIVITLNSACEERYPDEGLPLTLHRRSVLDQKVRMLTLQFGKDHLLAYDLQQAGLYAFWRGGVTWNGAPFNSIKTVQPERYGTDYLLSPHFNLFRRTGKDTLVTAFYSYKVNEPHSIELIYKIEQGGTGETFLHEIPFIYTDSAEVRLVRRFWMSGLVDQTYYLDTIPLGDAPVDIESTFPEVPSTPVPDRFVSGSGSQYWLDRSGCTTCHAPDYRMIGPSYQEISGRYNTEDLDELVANVVEGSSGKWGAQVMIPHPDLPTDAIGGMVRYMLSWKPAEREQSSELPAPKPEDEHNKEAVIPGFGSPLVAVHPAYDLHTIRPSWFRPRVGGMTFAPDGTLYVSTWDSLGAVYALEGVATGDTNQIEIRTYATGLAEPLGLEVVDGDLYVMQKHELTHLIDQDADGVAEEYRVLCDDFGVTPDFHEFAYEIVHQDGHFYGTLGLAMRLMPHELQLPDRGTVFRVGSKGEFEVIARGLRQPNGIGRGPDNQLFISENQGRWVPACKIIHVRQGDWHGCHLGAGSRFDSLSMTPPAIWLPQDEIGNSPGEPITMQDGPYQGQMLIGDVTHGGIKRLVLEKVGGLYQGAVFRFSQGLEAGVNRLEFGPDGGLYVGGVGMHGGWSHQEAQYGLQKLIYNGKVPFEILDVTATADGFTITFTQPLALDNETLPLEVRQWHYEPTAQYGGPKLDEETLQVAAWTLSDDRKTLQLEVPGLKAKYVVYFSFAPTLKSQQGASLWSGETWYTLNNIPTRNTL